MMASCRLPVSNGPTRAEQQRGGQDHTGENRERDAVVEVLLLRDVDDGLGIPRRDPAELGDLSSAEGKKRRHDHQRHRRRGGPPHDVDRLAATTFTTTAWASTISTTNRFSRVDTTSASAYNGHSAVRFRRVATTSNTVNHTAASADNA